MLTTLVRARDCHCLRKMKCGESTKHDDRTVNGVSSAKQGIFQDMPWVWQPGSTPSVHTSHDIGTAGLRFAGRIAWRLMVVFHIHTVWPRGHNCCFTSGGAVGLATSYIGFDLIT